MNKDDIFIIFLTESRMVDGMYFETEEQAEYHIKHYCIEESCSIIKLIKDDGYEFLCNRVKNEFNVTIGKAKELVGKGNVYVHGVSIKDPLYSINRKEVVVVK